MTCNLVSRFPCTEAPLGLSLADACNASVLLTFMSLLNTLATQNEKISGRCERVKPVDTPDEEYDFVVIGGGAGGSVVAGRLSEIYHWKVLLLEAGPDEPVGAEIPGFTGRFIGTKITWNYTTTNESHACLATNGSCAWPQGKNLGGNTVHNGMIYLRGNPTDYNRWAEEGNVGWTWEEVEPFYIKGEDNGEIERVGRKHHGTGGPLSVERFPYVAPLGLSIFKAAGEAGFNISEDLNGDQITGFSLCQGANKNGVRRSSARAYLWPVRNRRNLHVSLNCHVTRVIIENRRAIGVEYHKDGHLRTVCVTKEVIVAGGVVESPHLLLLSGIGPKDHLESMNVKVIHDLPGVGENLHDHPAAILTFTFNDTDTNVINWASAMEYLAFQNGSLSGIGVSEVLGMLASNATAPDFPDLQLFLLSYSQDCKADEIAAQRSTGRRIVNILSAYLHPRSRGRITLASNDPFEYPVIWANYLSDSNDVDRIVDGIRLILKLVDTQAVRAYNLTLLPVEACSDREFNSDEYWTCVARQQNYPLYHQGGTCKMGPSSDSMAVVDPRLRVHGIEGLRVADNSIMPQVISGNTVAPAMMIGERAADFIKKDWNRQSSQMTCSNGVMEEMEPEFCFRGQR